MASRNTAHLTWNGVIECCWLAGWLACCYVLYVTSLRARTEAAPRQIKKASHETQKPIHQARRPSMHVQSTESCRAHACTYRQRRSIATSRLPPSPHQTSQPGRPAAVARAGPEKRDPQLMAFFGRATACALTYSTAHPLRDEETHKHPSISPPRRTARRFNLRRPCRRGGTQSWPLPATDRTMSAAPGRLLGDRRRARAQRRSALLSLPQPTADTVHPARPCIESCMELEAQGFTSNPTDLCLSVRSVHPFFSRRTIHHRSCALPTRPLPVSISIEAPNVSFFSCRDGTTFVRGPWRAIVHIYSL